MTDPNLLRRLREITDGPPPVAGRGRTQERFDRLWQIGLEDLSLAKLAEAHFDALAILAEAQRSPQPQAIYGVWASERPGAPMTIRPTAEGYHISGEKGFCSGAGYVDCVLMTVDGRLFEIDLRRHQACVRMDSSTWETDAFRMTNTSTIQLTDYPVVSSSELGAAGWYTQRPGFWHGALGPAACWAGGAEGLVHFAESSKRNDPHTLAHLGAVRAAVWGMKAFLTVAASEIDNRPEDPESAMVRALVVRHLIEHHSTEIMRRIARAYGPHPLAIDRSIALRYHELDLFLRQSHAERDLELIGRSVPRELL